MEEITKIKKEIIELRIKVEDHDQAMVGVSMLEDKVDEHHEILINKSSFIAYTGLSLIVSVISVLLALISIFLQFLKNG